LAFLHKLNYIWRSCKPEDILIDEEGYIVISDFGSGTFLQNPKDRTKSLSWSIPEYICPELLEKGESGTAGDWWSFGCLLYELVVGSPPFWRQNCSYFQLYEYIKTQPLHIPPNVSEDFKQLITGLLERTPESRLGFENDIDDIGKHPWFNSIDWTKLITRTMVSPFIINEVINNKYENISKEFINDNDNGICEKFKKKELLPAISDNDNQVMYLADF